MKALWSLFAAQAPRRNALVFYAALASLASVQIIAAVNSAAHHTGTVGNLSRDFFLFLVSLGIYALASHQAYRLGIDIFYQELSVLTSRIVGKIRDADLITVERIGQAEIYNRLTQETAQLYQASLDLVGVIQSVLQLVFIMIYLATLSIGATLLSGAVFLLGALFYAATTQAVGDSQRRTTDREVADFELFQGLLLGFKQIKIHHRRGDDLLADLAAESDAVRGLRTRLGELLYRRETILNGGFFLILGFNAFLLPLLISNYSDVFSQLNVAVLFVLMPVRGITVWAPRLANVEAALTQIVNLETTLDKAQADRVVPSPPEAIQLSLPFRRLTISQFAFQYNQDVPGGFRLGPIDLAIGAGELLYITGGNGSGKSTFLKLLTGLYRPTQGQILLDEQSIIDENLQSYRELFAVILGDFHLFSRLYGHEAVEPEQARELLRMMEIDHKTDFVNGKFTNIQLSTGQRKRLAMVVALLQDRPIYIFDEWAADQDPVFRDRYYQEILPQLQRRGKTIIAATHDDRYFHLADRRIKLDLGRVDSIT